MFKQPNPIPFTKEGYDKLQGKLDTLQKYREEVLVRLQRAREQGDLSENGAYKSARFELSDTDRNIRQLQFQIKYGKVEEPRTDGTVGIGNTVTLQKEDGSKVKYQIVGTYEADPIQGKISIESPMGLSVLGRKIGEDIVVNGNKLKINEVV